MRRVVELTNSRLTNYGQLRRNTDHRLAQLALAITTLVVTARLIYWRNRWSPASRPVHQASWGVGRVRSRALALSRCDDCRRSGG
jgi:hypothetical protein